MTDEKIFSQGCIKCNKKLTDKNHKVLNDFITICFECYKKQKFTKEEINLLKKGLTKPTLRCPICKNGVEMQEHGYFCFYCSGFRRDEELINECSSEENSLLKKLESLH